MVITTDISVQSQTIIFYTSTSVIIYQYLSLFIVKIDCVVEKTIK